MKSVLRTIALVVAFTGPCAVAFAEAPGGSSPAPQGQGMHNTSPVHMACRAKIDAQSLTGEQRKAAMHACMEPHVNACLQKAAQKGLAKGPEHKQFVDACMQGA